MRLDGRHHIETPENVEVRFDLAGLGSRGCAMLADTMLVVAFLVLVAAVVALALPAGSARAWGVAGTWMVAGAIAVASLALVAYHAVCELAMSGQTPGKRLMRLRVIREDGTAATATDLLIRNLVRLVDMLPGTYGVAAVAAFLSPLHQRLGDMAAGTLVVKEGTIDLPSTEAWQPALAPPSAATPSPLSAQERQVVSSFLRRRAELVPAARAALAERIARPLHARHGGEIADAESYLERLLEGTHHGG